MHARILYMLQRVLLSLLLGTSAKPCACICIGMFVTTAPSFALNFGHPVFTSPEQGKFVMIPKEPGLSMLSLRPRAS